MAKQYGQNEADNMEDSEIENKINEKVKDDNKDQGLPEVDPETGRPESEEDGEGGTPKAKEPKASKSKASAKSESKEEDEDEEEYEESKKTKKELFGKDDDEDEDEEDDEDEDEEDEDEAEESKKSKKEEIDVDVSEDVAALVAGEELSETFKSKAATIFEAAVKSKISKIRKQIREESKKEQEKKISSLEESMQNNVDKYLNYAVGEWMSENKLAVEQGVRNEVTESFIAGLKKLFEEHYIDVPEEKEDVFESLVVEVAELEEKLDTQTEKHMEIVNELNTYKAASVFKTVSEGMVDTDIEKLKELTEDVDYDTDTKYAEKLNVIKNSYFKSDKKDVVDNKKTAGTNNPVVTGTSDSRMDGVMSAISNLSKKK